MAWAVKEIFKGGSASVDRRAEKSAGRKSVHARSATLVVAESEHMTNLMRQDGRTRLVLDNDGPPSRNPLHVVALLYSIQPVQHPDTEHLDIGRGAIKLPAILDDFIHATVEVLEIGSPGVEPRRKIHRPGVVKQKTDVYRSKNVIDYGHVSLDRRRSATRSGAAEPVCDEVEVYPKLLPPQHIHFQHKVE
jgi:hypothetical protein